MKQSLSRQLLKDKLCVLSTEADLKGETCRRVQMEYLLEQYDRENLFLNKQVQQLLRQNQILQTSQQKRGRLQPTQNDQLADLRERYRKAITGDDHRSYREKYKVEISNSSKGLKQSTSVHNFAEKDRQKKIQNNVHHELTKFNSTEKFRGKIDINPEKHQSTVKRIEDFSFKNEQTLNVNREPYLHQTTLPLTDDPSKTDNSPAKVIQLGRNSKSKSKSPSPSRLSKKEDQILPQLKRDGSDLNLNCDPNIQKIAKVLVSSKKKQLKESKLQKSPQKHIQQSHQANQVRQFDKIMTRKSSKHRLNPSNSSNFQNIDIPNPKASQLIYPSKSVQGLVIKHTSKIRYQPSTNQSYRSGLACKECEKCNEYANMRLSYKIPESQRVQFYNPQPLQRGKSRKKFLSIISSQVQSKRP